MTDRVPGAPGRYNANLPNGELQKLQNGEPFAITLTRDDAPIVEGTPYSKAAVLPDELAAKLCPDLTDPAPKDAFAALYQIVDQGMSGKWAYRKWANGAAECWSVGRITLNRKFSSVLSRTETLPFPIMNPNATMALLDGTVDEKLIGPVVLSYSETEWDDTLYFFLTKESGGFTDVDYAQVHVKIVGTWNEEGMV